MQYSITICLSHPTEDTATTTLTVTARGQVTFRKQVLQHLGIKPGEKIELSLLPDGRAELKATQQKGSLRELAGFLKDKTNGNVLTIKEIDDAIADASAAAGAGEA
ncbi:MAG: transcriptional regulator [Lysobacterales bacterium CG02_land_8_20_14_3_00_62_12]|nr:MAG: transcriptional regulator [Xanthomonadales bacterium CG02_land_8_20_14_3_00_62_12]PJA43191.1 MAG: transcriptional regulator [Xanthomonadales bacterium CG_4_9_14_3_um_filter_62_6]